MGLFASPNQLFYKGIYPFFAGEGLVKGPPVVLMG